MMSGQRDSNLRPPAPKTGALTGLRHAPNTNYKIAKFFSELQIKFITLYGFYL